MELDPPSSCYRHEPGEMECQRKTCGRERRPASRLLTRRQTSEEADQIRDLVADIMKAAPTWINREGVEAALGLDDILIIAPYNAQVFALQERIPGARIGTVDKFQGQEAPIVIYSMTTSSHADAPRGMEFLYSPNRFNVATSRAKCVCILVGSPRSSRRSVERPGTCSWQTRSVATGRQPLSFRPTEGSCNLAKKLDTAGWTHHDHERSSPRARSTAPLAWDSRSRVPGDGGFC
jgi:hypothetical protein